MKVRCLYNDGYEGGLEKGKIYECTKKREYDWHVVIPDVYVEFWDLDRFDEVKTMTKDDLKTGMVVETREYGKSIVIGNRFLQENSNMYLRQFNNDLKSIYAKDWDIVKVYEEPLELGCLNDLQTHNYTLLWEREEKSESQLELDKLIADKAEYDKNFDKHVEELKSKI